MPADLDRRDRALLAAARQGDSAAVASLAERHERAVFGYLAARLLDPDAAGELAQRVFERFLADRRNAAAETTVRGALLAAAADLLRGYLRKRRGRAGNWAQWMPELDAESPPPVDFDSAVARLPQCLATLEESPREALSLYYRDRFPRDAIAAKLKRSPAAVDALLRQGRQAVARHLQAEQVDDAE